MKQNYKLIRLLPLYLALCCFERAAAQAYVNVANTANSGTASYGVGVSTKQFDVTGPYTATSTAVDHFYDATGSGTPIEISGNTAPSFGNLVFSNGATSTANITNTAGIIINTTAAFNNGITSTIRTNRAAGLAAAIQFLGSAVYTPTLTPALGTDVTFTDGYISKVNPAAFVFPVGNVTDLRPITATGTGTFATSWTNNNVASSSYTGALPTGTTALNTNGFWEWNGTADATAIVSIPDESGLTATASQLSVMGYNGTAWTNLGGVFSTVTENSNNSVAITVPLNTQALAIGNSVPFVMVKTKAFLQGGTSAGVMSTTLNSLGLIPLKQPYNIAPFGSGATGYLGTESVAAGFFAGHTNIVDWILVELRDATTPATIVASRAGFLLSSGAIVDLDGTSDLSFLGAVAGTAVGVASTNYFTAIRHRNHLGIRSATTQSLSTTATLFDFSLASTNANGSNAMKNLGAGVFAMWAGNVEYTANASGKQTVNYGAIVSDVAKIQAFVTNAIGNGFHLASFAGASVTGIYNVNDTNMDGNVSFGAIPSDATLVQSNVTNFPTNGFHLSSAVSLFEQLP